MIPAVALADVLEIRVGVGGDSSGRSEQWETSWQDPVSTRTAVVNLSVSHCSGRPEVPTAYPGRRSWRVVGGGVQAKVSV